VFQQSSVERDKIEEIIDDKILTPDSVAGIKGFNVLLPYVQEHLDKVEFIKKELTETDKSQEIDDILSKPETRE
jgi:hypothetical protein